MTYEKRRPFRGGADLLGGGQHPYATQAQNATIPAIIARHLRVEDYDVDGSIAWAEQIALQAAEWLERSAA